MKYPRTRSRIQELAGINEALKPADNLSEADTPVVEMDQAAIDKLVKPAVKKLTASFAAMHKAGHAQAKALTKKLHGVEHTNQRASGAAPGDLQVIDYVEWVELTRTFVAVYESSNGYTNKMQLAPTIR